MVTKLKLKTPAQEVKLISCQIAEQTQGQQMIEVVALPNGDRLRVDIYVEPYPFQSHARIERWSGSQWMPVAFRLFKLMQTQHYPTNFMDFKQDRDWLINEAANIIGVSP